MGQPRVPMLSSIVGVVVFFGLGSLFWVPGPTVLADSNESENRDAECQKCRPWHLNNRNTQNTRSRCGSVLGGQVSQVQH